VIDLGRSCSRYRPLLVDFVDHGEVGPETRAAFNHLDGCNHCTEAIESTMLTITALRRLSDEVADVDPSPDAWPRLRLRITGWRRRPAVMSPLAGVAMSFAIVAMLVLPFRLGGEGWIDLSATASQSAGSLSAVDRRIEASYIAFSRRNPTTGGAIASGSVLTNIPTEIWLVRKEVHSAKPSVRPPEPI
jgi:anti-sigma factor RsiW